MFFIAGITGNVGGAAARELAASGRRVRGLTRDRTRAAGLSRIGAEIRDGDLTDATAVAEALRDVEGAFLIVPPTLTPAAGYPEAKAAIAAYRVALAQSPPPRLVMLSSFGSQQTSGLGNITSTHLMEEAFGGVPFPVAFLRAGAFMENHAAAVRQAKATGAFDVFMSPTDRAVPMVATADIGKHVAHLLATGWEGKKIVEIGSRFSPNDLAEGLADVLGTSVVARAVPRENWTAAMTHMGMPAGSTAPYEEMMDGINSGWIDFGVAGTEAVPATTTPAQFFARIERGE